MVRGTMNVDIADLLQLAASLDEGGIKSIEISSAGRSLRMVMEEKADASLASDAGGRMDICTSGDCVAVLAKTPGVFLTVHPSRTEPLVRPGATVKTGDIIGLLRIGHILAPVTAPCSGILTQILATSGTTVDFGTRLAEIRSSEPSPVEARSRS